MEITATIKVKKSKCMDDLFELNENFSFLIDLIPDNKKKIARPRIKKISEILKSFVEYEL